MEMFDKMVEAGVRPNTITYSALISAFEKGSQYERAVQTFEEMRAAGVPADTIVYNALISACEKRGQWERASQALEEMKVSALSRAAGRAYHSPNTSSSS